MQQSVGSALLKFQSSSTRIACASEIQKEMEDYDTDHSSDKDDTTTNSVHTTGSPHSETGS